MQSVLLNKGVVSKKTLVGVPGREPVLLWECKTWFTLIYEHIENKSLLCYGNHPLLMSHGDIVIMPKTQAG